MVNPFDKTFFKFLLGFIVILVISFGVLCFADYSNLFPSPQTLTATQK